MAIASPTEERMAAQAGALSRNRMISAQVIETRPAARGAMTLVLAAPGTRRAPAPYRPGQFVTLAFRTESGGTITRSYSLCGDGRGDMPWEITVKRVSDGLISNFIIDQTRVGMVTQTSLPQGNFTLPEALRGRKLAFVAAGSGITPVYGMLRAIARLAPEERPHVRLYYAYHSPQDGIFARELVNLDPSRQWLNQTHYVSTNGHRLEVASAMASLGRMASAYEWYVCGPASLKASLEVAAGRYGVPRAQIHSEVFASPMRARGDALSGAADVVARIRVADTGDELEARAGETLLEALERNGYSPDYSCRAGACGTCRLHLLAGSVCNGEGENGALSASELRNGYILSCSAEPRGNVVVESAGAPPRGNRIGGSRGATVGGPRRKSRSGIRKALRLSLAAASLGLFATVWGMTSHTTASHTTQSATGSSSTTGGVSAGGSSSSANNSAGSGSITFPQFQTPANTSSGGS